MLLLPLILIMTSFIVPVADEQIVFLVESYSDESGYYTEPIAYIKDGRYIAVVDPSDESFEPYKEFSGKYFALGKQYPVYRDEQRLGNMTVIGRDSEFACMQLTAQINVTYSGTAKLTPGESGLAFSTAHASKTLATGAGTPADSTLALSLLSRELTKEKVPKAALKKLQLNRLRKIDLDGDGDLETIATGETVNIRYSKKLKMDMTMIYFMTIIIDNDKVVYAKYLYGAEEGDENGYFASRQDIAGVADLEGDGSTEIVFRNFYYEAWDYSIVAKKNGKWQFVWQGGGGGC